MMSELMTDRDWQATVRAVKISPVASTQRAALDAKRKRIIRLVVNGLIEETEAQGLLTDVNREIADLPLDVSPLKPALNRLQSFGEAWDAANMEQRNKLCAEMFSEVVLDTVSKDETGIVVKPHTELMPLFASRREYVLAYVGPAGFEPATNRL